MKRGKKGFLLKTRPSKFGRKGKRWRTRGVEKLISLQVTKSSETNVKLKKNNWFGEARGETVAKVSKGKRSCT